MAIGTTDAALRSALRKSARQLFGLKRAVYQPNLI